MKSIVASVFLSVGIIFFAYAGEGAKEHGRYEVFLYRNKDVNNPKTVFSPSDKIFIHIKFPELLEGDYTLNSYWYNPSGKLQETTNHKFTLKQKSPYTTWAWLVLQKKGQRSRLLSATDYSIKFYGKWHVEIFINEKKIVIKDFEVR